MLTSAPSPVRHDTRRNKDFMARPPKNRSMKGIPVIDIFAGPGGLGEGFASLRTDANDRAFRIKLSIEMDKYAHRTLLLRSFFRQFDDPEHVPDDYYQYLRGEGRWRGRTLEDLLDSHPHAGDAARREAWCRELSSASRVAAAVDKRIIAVLGPEGAKRPWVLVGGPPCQAYSLVGRARMLRPKGDAFYKDRRHTLYREYLRILADFRPAVFVMENVKGLLSATSQSGDRVLAQILRDLERPHAGLRYRLFALSRPTRDGLGLAEVLVPTDFVVRSEQFGIPQARHRLIILGVRVDGGRPDPVLRRHLEPSTAPVSLKMALSGLPKLRSGVSRAEDSAAAWSDVLTGVLRRPWFKSLAASKAAGDQSVAVRIGSAVNKLPRGAGRGARFVSWKSAPSFENTRLAEWFVDERLGGACNHETRSHRSDDLERYLFLSAFAAVHQVSPKLQDLPERLLPDHANVGEALLTGMFNDRFRVQLLNQPSTTITSHISKDGHYFIHPDPAQCRSLTVREAARLQTFPDNYFFEGPRTEQYHQVGNAVPPLLARQIAEIVLDGIREDWGR